MANSIETPQNAGKSSREETPVAKTIGLLIDPEVLTKINMDLHQVYASVQSFDNLQQQAQNISNRYGPGTRLYGFVEKTKDLAKANPQYDPAFFSFTGLNQLVEQIEQLRNMKDIMDIIESMVKNLLLLTTHEAYQMALGYYRSVRELAKQNVGGSKGLYDELSQYFERTTRLAAEPTRRQLERDMHALLDGMKDGKIVIENQRPQSTGGVHTVLDNTRNDRSALRTTLDEEETIK